MSIWKLDRAIKIRMLDILLTGSAGNILMIITPLYVASQYSVWLAGIVVMVGVFFSFIGSLFSGYLSDTYGRRKIILPLSMIRTTTFLLIGLFHYLDLPAYWTVGMLVINLAIIGTYSPAISATTYDLTSDDNRKFVLTYVYWLANVSIGIGVITGAYLYSQVSIGVVALGVGVLSACSLAMLYFFMPETLKPSKERGKGSLRGIVTNYAAIRHDKLFLLHLSTALVIFVFESQLVNYINVRLEGREFDLLGFWNISGTEMLGYLVTLNTAVVVGFVWLSTYSMKRFSDRQLLRFSLPVFFLTTLVMAGTFEPWILLLATFLYSLSEVILLPVMDAMIGDIATEDNTSSYLAVVSSFIDIGILLAAFVITLSEFMSSSGILFLLGACAVVGLFLMQRLIGAVETRRLTKPTA